VAIIASPIQPKPLSLPFCILYGSQTRGRHEEREYHETGCTSILSVR